MYRVLFALIVATFSIQVHAAQIDAEPPDADGMVFIAIIGDLVPGDEHKFVRLALPIERAVVVFNSYGGDLKAGIEIGRAIRLKEYWTIVSDTGVCASACGLAWLGGVRRYVFPGARVGFHAASVQKNGEAAETGLGNALTGAYLNQLGLSQSAVAYITFAAPNKMTWLSAEDAKSVGIEVTLLAPEGSEREETARTTDGQSPIPEDPVSPSSEAHEGSTAFKRLQAADIFGFDLESMPLMGLTLAMCEQTCEITPTCKAYTFNRVNKACFLKSGGKKVLGNPIADAGFKAEIEADLRKSSITILERTDLPGGDYKDLREFSFEQCAERCERDNRCAAFTYVPRYQQCWLKSSIPKAVTYKSSVSGTKSKRY